MNGTHRPQGIFAASAGVELVESRRREAGRLRLLRHPENRGYRAALRSGLREA